MFIFRYGNFGITTEDSFAFSPFGESPPRTPRQSGIESPTGAGSEFAPEIEIRQVALGNDKKSQKHEKIGIMEA